MVRGSSQCSCRLGPEGAGLAGGGDGLAPSGVWATSGQEGTQGPLIPAPHLKYGQTEVQRGSAPHSRSYASQRTPGTQLLPPHTFSLRRLPFPL